MKNDRLERTRDFLEQLKSHADALAREGIDAKELQRLIDALDDETKAGAPDHHRVHELLNELYATVEVAYGKIVSSGVLSVLNHLFAIGVPTP
jgi:hypothetical protein